MAKEQVYEELRNNPPMQCVSLHVSGGRKMATVEMVKRTALALAGIGAVLALAVWMYGKGGPEVPDAGDAPEALTSVAVAPEGEVTESTLEWGSESSTIPESAFARGGKPSSNDITERARAESELLEASRNRMNQLPEEELRRLALSGDSSAQEALAAKLFIDSPGEALEFALAAADAGRPMGAFMVADLLATEKNEVAEGLLFLDSYQEKRGPSALVARYRKNYLSIHQLTQEEILSDYRLLKSNRDRGEPQKYALTERDGPKASARPAPP